MKTHIEKPAISFRTARLHDIGDLRRFEQGIVAAERPFDPTLREGPIQYYDIESMLASDSVHFLVAHVGTELIACGFARIDRAKPFLRQAKQAYLGLMYVDPRYRGQSINGAIVERLKRWCLTMGVNELRLEVYCNNLAAIAAYEKSGFSQHMVEMRLGI
jgi:RimJ/RimL family protein N-acetyltransferase